MKRTHKEDMLYRLAEWRVCATKRLVWLNNCERSGVGSDIAHIYMENWLAACECVMAYEKALGVNDYREKIDV